MLSLHKTPNFFITCQNYITFYKKRPSHNKKSRYLYLLSSYFIKSMTKDKLPSITDSSTISIGGLGGNRSRVRNPIHSAFYMFSLFILSHIS